ncbi:MAG TPA: zinc ABC transporter substrate-binding protein, partial [Syntrophobacteria bacterium]|nr:zinc ABC transporter substrate-binding protein [Syntrophobacteria bacterium]
MRWRVFFFFVLALVGTLSGLVVSCGDRQPGGTPLGQGGKVRVITTLFPLYDFARTIGQDRVEVLLLLPPGVEAHSFEPKPSDIVKISGADLFIYTGKFMEPWVEAVLKGVTNPKLKVVDASVGIPLLTAASEAHKHEPGHQQGEPAAKGKTQEDGRQRLGLTDVDPHVWLDLGNAAKMVDTIAAGLTEVDPAHRDLYAKNAEGYRKQLDALDAR